ncbi:RNA exonuclease 1 [Dendrobium catenatum]|uniref:RNA exonuclease 1 n=1 Tax=Dendrobium catenatum TaxID=906689 RepID=A0A2I0VVU8_9ASPA|nr:RNA exonuclease 1 [Dendrobium catenatum]
MALPSSGFPPLSGPSLLGASPQAPPLSYASNLAASPLPREDWQMSFVKPAKKLSFASTDLSEGKSLWNLSLVGYSLGPRPYYERLLASMEKAWKLKGSLSLLSLADDFFLLKFTATEDYDMVWSGGPWFLLGRPFVLQRWNPKFQPKRDESASIPIWIKVPNLPLALWTPSGISKIASYVGEPLYVDTLTAKRTRLTFARICVKVDKNSDFPEEIPLEIDGEDLTLSVVYDWKPSKCEGCGSLVHPFALCPKNPTPKPSLPVKPGFRGRSKSRKPSNIPRHPSRGPLSAPLNPPLPSDAILSNHLLPNLNLPQSDSASSSIHSKLLKFTPPQVTLANSFGSLPVEDPLVEPSLEANLNGISVEEASSSSPTFVKDIPSPKTTTNPKDSPSTSSSSKMMVGTKSPPKKGKAKAKTAKKAKPHK